MSLVASYYPNVDLDDTDEGQLDGYLQNIDQLERLRAKHLGEAVAMSLAKMFGGK